MLNLPFWMLRRNTITIEYLLQLCHTRGNTSVTAIPPMLFEREDATSRRDAFAQARAASFGPGYVECTAQGTKYGPSVTARNRKSGDLPGDWLQRIRLYREGLAAHDWQLSPLLQQYALPRNHDRTTFKCPVTVIFGKRDLALDSRIVLDGIERHFQSSTLVSVEETGSMAETDQSHIVELKEAGHWPMLDSEQGKEAIIRTMWWMVKPEYGLDSALSSWDVTQKDELKTKSFG